jgi:hypothetical protein
MCGHVKYNIAKANTEAAIAVYLILRRGAARSDAITAAAKATLDKKDQELISAVLTVHKSVEAERNSLAHGCWGTCNKIPDAVLWVDLADNANFIADYFSKEPVNIAHSLVASTQISPKNYFIIR